jgi:hypothetical protein
MLAGERFSDHPRSVSPTIASFLRVYNDRVDDERRQDLLEIAADIVGTRNGWSSERARARRCLAWIKEVDGRRGGHGVLVWMPGGCGQAGQRAAMAAVGRDDDLHRQALALVEELIAIGRDGSVAALGETQPAVLDSGYAGAERRHDLAGH